MKREAIKKVVEVAVERNFITLDMATYGEEARIEEIVSCIQEGIEERNKKAIDELEDKFLDELNRLSDCTTTGEDGEERPLTAKEVVEIIDSNFMALLADIDIVLNE